MITSIVGALVEAWEEVKVQKARVIMSLIGVVAAVTAMTTVVALGNLMAQADRERQERWDGRNLTLSVNVDKKVDESGDMMGSMEFMPEQHSESSQRTRPLDEPLPDPIGDRFKAIMERFDVPFWARSVSFPATFKELNEAQTLGTVHGRPVEPVEQGYGSTQVEAVDPMYGTIYRLNMLHGRWLTPSDSDQVAIPIVINETFWKTIGSPPIEHPFLLSSQGQVPATYRLVGVLDQVDPWEGPVGYIPYESWLWAANDTGGIYPALRVWVGDSEPLQMRDALAESISAALGGEYEVWIGGGEAFHQIDEAQSILRKAVLGIGTIVIALGALGLLNVAIVTVRQRIREIGIRRAVGASSKRIFFAVFMESVVDTFVAGLIGVMISILIIRLFPWESVNVVVQDNPAFPMSAAIAGVGIATAVGALCGIIPAVMALRVRPIDAIRY
ncbi:ABC transporter permease [Trueperella bialowiezensis]|uniref:Macrolide export ATP-binding/permease protein MacB n=1 Tax=Trueperella bialowiezensis TaxID=312285 RepID=A0A448PF09_9ACTO|nr:ABC transporter permease [Trueperella bialowiezensis]VEI13506.1 Macrolide export ATP-binding/permease protein MacB [Trueperella bialowiezensis]